jgi:hypothetical protein
MGELRGHASSATHKQTGWGLHQRRWSNDACATPQRRPHHELAWIRADFLSEQRRVTAFVETAGGWVANESLLNARARLKITWLRNSFHGKEATAPLHRRACTGECAFFAESMHESKQVLWAPCMCRCVRKHFLTRLLQGVQMRSCMCSLFIQRWGTRVGALS